ncbi:MAG: hypothetical protein IPG95_00435 [Saprospiraceae bacterium]|nr:hypothetical protein [Saprospiraceae bacterium]
MSKKFFIVAMLFLSWNPESIARQWLVFFAKDGFFDGVLRQSFGHAYVGLIKEDTASKQNLLLACWGFYPKGGLQTSGIVGYMNGSIKMTGIVNGNTVLLWKFLNLNLLPVYI